MGPKTTLPLGVQCPTLKIFASYYILKTNCFPYDYLELLKQTKKNVDGLHEDPVLRLLKADVSEGSALNTL